MTTSIVSSVLASSLSSPTSLFDSLLVALGGSTFFWKLGLYFSNKRDQNKVSGDCEAEDQKPKEVAALQKRFLIVFWLMRMADWLQGPYFYEVYMSKIINGQPVGLDLVSKLFLVGFASTGIFGPYIGRLVDSVGRKAGTIAYAILYAIGKRKD